MKRTPQQRCVELGRRIFVRRTALGLSRAAFARKCGVSDSSIARIERGEEVRVSTYLAIVGYLGRAMPEALAERIASLPDAARAQVLELIRSFEGRRG